jgi:hypothetical protein
MKGEMRSFLLGWPLFLLGSSFILAAASTDSGSAQVMRMISIESETPQVPYNIKCVDRSNREIVFTGQGLRNFTVGSRLPILNCEVSTESKSPLRIWFDLGQSNFKRQVYQTDLIARYDFEYPSLDRQESVEGLPAQLPGENFADPFYNQRPENDALSEPLHHLNRGRPGRPLPR